VFTAVNLFIAMAIAGLWHGAAWTFVLWGLWHGVGLAAHRAWSLSVVPRFAVLAHGGLGVRTLSVVTTFAFVCFGWVLFAATSAANAAAVYEHLIGH
jgi:alginate O-acetyltransferase complex protein AlgI